MWMMGYNDGAEFNTLQDSFNGRKLRPLMPRPPPAATNPPPPCISTRLHGPDILAFNHHLAMTEQNKRELSSHQVVVSSRWNPTPEQLQTLEELYRRGTRTPSAEQIQHITAQLRRYGKIEGKNVFYWFQNHKARERQKRRRQLESVSDEQPINNNNSNNHNNVQKKESEGASRTDFEVEETKNNWPSPTNCCTTIPEKTVPMQRTGKPTAAVECSKADGWVDLELQQTRNNATWQMMQLSCSSPNSTPTISTISSHQTALSFEQNLLASQDFGTLSIQPYDTSTDQGEVEEAQTLELFPLQSEGVDDRGDCGGDNKDAKLTNEVTGYQFYEFLPLKN